MSYCINPSCLNRVNLNEPKYCHNCGSALIINERYSIVKPLRKLNQHHYTEVFEVDNLGTTKILKVLTSERHRLVDLFKQEADILRKLSHLDVPRVDTFFPFSLRDSKKKLHCLVMEQIPGCNLKEWLEQNSVLSETLAIDWLSQLTTFLNQLHLEKILHRDIKPSNIMVRPDGKLILIDFGTARQMTTTYIKKVATADITRIYTSGYTAPEQVKGQAVYQSDFFALGCTFVHLLTGIHPDNLEKNSQDNRLIWRDQAPQISAELGDLIDELITPLPEKRPNTVNLIQYRLQLIQKLSNQELSSEAPSTFFNPRSLVSRKINQTWFNLGGVVALCLAIAISLMGIRYLGLLQSWEIAAFDRLMIMRPLEKIDSHLVLITIDDADIEYQNQRGMPIRWSLSDAALLQLFQKLEQYQPKTIGIDIYRDFAVNPDYPELANYLSSDRRLFVPCKVPAAADGEANGISPPPEVPKSRWGFSDIIADQDDIVRRHLLFGNPPPTASCSTEYALNFQIALHFLQEQGLELTISPDEQLQIGSVKLKVLENHSSGYQNIDASGYQILFNYLAVDSPQDIAPQISLRDVLEDHIDPDLKESLADSIVLIGVTASSAVNYWKTPYSKVSSSPWQQIPGLFIQAQGISQIVNAVLDQRPLIWWWSTEKETLWILAWAFLGGLFPWFIRSPWYLGIAIAVANILLFSICFAILVQGGWIPLIPTVLALIITPVGVARLVKKYR